MSKKDYIKSYSKYTVFSILLILISILLMPVAVGSEYEENIQNKIYMTAGETIDLSEIYGDNINWNSVSEDIVSVDSSRIVAEKSGESVLYGKLSDGLNDVKYTLNVFVFDSNLNILYITKDQKTKTFDFSETDYVNLNSVSVEDANKIFFESDFNSNILNYDVILFEGTGFACLNDSMEWSGYFKSSIETANSVGTVIIQTTGNLTESDPFDIEYKNGAPYIPKDVYDVRINKNLTDDSEFAKNFFNKWIRAGDENSKISNGKLLGEDFANKFLEKTIRSVEENENAEVLKSEIYTKAKEISNDQTAEIYEVINVAQNLKKIYLNEKKEITDLKIYTDKKSREKLGTAETFDFESETVTIPKGSSIILKTKALPLTYKIDEKNISWKSSDENIVTAEDGLIFGKNIGSAEVYVEYEGNEKTIGKTVKLNVEDKLKVLCFYSMNKVPEFDLFSDEFDVTYVCEATYTTDERKANTITLSDLAATGIDSYDIIIDRIDGFWKYNPVSNGIFREKVDSLAENDVFAATRRNAFVYENDWKHVYPETGTTYEAEFNRIVESEETAQNKANEMQKMLAYGALNKKISYYDFLVPEEYTEKSWKLAESEIENAKLLLQNGISDENIGEFVKSSTDLKDAYKNLETVGEKRYESKTVVYKGLYKPGFIESEEVILNDENEIHLMYVGDVHKFETIVKDLNYDHETTYKKDIEYKWEIVNDETSDKSDGFSPVKITKSGLAKATGEGTAKIKRTDELGNTDFLKIKVRPEIKKIVLKPEEITLQIGDKYNIKAEIFPIQAAGEEITWNVDNKTVISITGEGKVEALNYGVTEITASAQNVVSNKLKINIKAPEGNRIEILTVGTSESENIKNVDSFLFAPYINYKFIPAYKKSTEPSDELLAEAECEFEKYDIVIFGSNGGHVSINEYVKSAKDNGKKIIIFDGDVPSYSSNKDITEDRFEKINSSYIKYTRYEGKVSDMWAEKFLYGLIEEYLPEKTEKIPDWKTEKIGILYIGNDLKDMKEAVEVFESQVYSGFADWDFRQLSENYNETEGSNYKEDLKKLKNIDPEKYDVVICDKFYHENEEKSAFSDVFGYDGNSDYWLKWPSVNFIALRQKGYISESENFEIYNEIDKIGLLPEDIGKVYEFYYKVLNKYGNKVIRNWKFTQYVEEGFIKHLVSGRVFKTVPEYIKWYESSEYYTEGAPYIGIFGFSVYVEEMKELSILLESKGYNIILGDGDSEGVYNDLDGYFINPDTGKSYVTCFVSFKHWAVNYWNQREGVRELKNLNVPVVKAVGTYRSQTGGNWGEIEIYDKNSGIPESTFSWMASASNVDGMIDFISLTPENLPWIAERAISWTNLNVTENSEKDIAFIYYNYPPGKEDIGANYLNVIRSIAGDGAKARIASGNDEIPINDPEFEGLIRRLNKEGYRADADKLPLAIMLEGGRHTYDYSEKNMSLILNEENLIHLMYSQGINVGSYAPGVLENMVEDYIEYHKNIPEGHKEDGSDWWGCELLPVSDYVEWLDDETHVNKTMNIKLRKELEETWGDTKSIVSEVPCKENDYFGGMIWNDKEGKVGKAKTNYFVIPMVKFGDVRLMPQPNRALASDKSLDSATYHGDIAPTHQYVAFFFWLNRGTEISTESGNRTGIYDFNKKEAEDIGVNGESWKADALINFGTHGTHEWLPGTSVGLKRTGDWGPVLMPALPNIYPYIVANVGEGLTAEYRGNALIISHLTPPMIKTQLYDDLIDMEAAVVGYQKQEAMAGGDPAIVKAYREVISENIYKLGWQASFKTVFDTYLTEDKAGISDDPKIQEELIKKYLTENDDVFNDFLEDYLHTYIKAIKENSLSYGMHTYSDFDTDQIPPMVWNMWSRQGLDKVFLETYFSGEGLKTIPTKNKIIIEGSNVSVDTEMGINTKYDESDILKFVEKLVSYKDENGNYADPGADEIRVFLDETFTQDAGNKEYQDKVIFFLLGPSGSFTDSKNTNPREIVESWKDEKIYEGFRERLFEFYWYHNVPNDLQGTPDPDLKKLAAVDGTVLGDYELTEKMTRFVSQVLTYENYEDDPAYAIEKCLALSGLGNNNTTRPWYNEEIVFYILGNNRIKYDEKLRDCSLSEENAILRALSAEFIEPSGGNDPVQRPEVLPTGRNFYGVDPSTYPTPAAWKVGKSMGKQMVTQYYENNGEWPDTFSFMRFGVDFMRDEGTLEASLFWLLGCEPTWTATGVFKGAVPVMETDSEKYEEMFKIKLKNGTEVYRPRVDIVYNSAGMRDGYGSMFRHIDRAVKAVSKLEDEENVSNNVKKNVGEVYDLLIKAGVSEEWAKELSTSRVYAQELGNYEIGTANLVFASGKMGAGGENQGDIKNVADTYLQNMGFLYSENYWGDSSPDIALAMKAMLGRADASVFSSSSNLYDSLDNDDVFQYFGIMNLASSMYDKEGNYIENKDDWKTPDMFIADTSNIDNFEEGDKVVYSASEFIHKNLDARYLNPKWIEGMQTSGYSGAGMFTEIFDNMYGWSVATNGELIGDSTWNRMFDTYMEQGLVEWTGNVSPYALQAITSRMIEANRTGYWDVTEDQMKMLVETYTDSVVQTGVACCHHTCGNPTFDKFMSGIMSAPFMNISKDQQQKYWDAVYEATERENPETQQPTQKPKEDTTSVSPERPNRINRFPIPTEGQSDSQSKPFDSDERGDGIGKSGGTAGNPIVSGVKMVEKTFSNTTSKIMEFLQNPTFSSSNMIVIIAVILIVGVLFYGFRKKEL